MNIVIVFQQMLVLFTMMIVGYICYKKKIIEEKGCKTVSSLIVNVLNPFLIISGVLGDEVVYSSKVIKENIIMVVIMYVLLIALSIIIGKSFRLTKKDYGSYRLMLTFSNLGFMGIPLISNVYGQGAVILVAFYILGYNILIYSYGIYLAGTEREEKQSIKGQWKKMLNPGLASCVIAIFIFSLDLKFPSGVSTFVSYMGNAAVPLAMIMVGVSLAKIEILQIFKNIRLIILTVLKLLVIPIACTYIFRPMGFDPTVFGVFILLIAMPVGSVVPLIESEYGREDNSLCASAIALTTLFTLITIPFVAIFV